MTTANEPAPLTHLTGHPWPKGIAAHWWHATDGMRIRYAHIPAVGASRGTVVLCNGRADFIEKHFEVLCALQQRGWAVLAFDWRGQGLSDRLTADPLKGHAVDFDHHLNDLRGLLAVCAPHLTGPLTVLGHSMGGALALRAVQRGDIIPARLVLSAPMLGINTGAIPNAVGRAAVAGLMALGLREGFFPGRATDPLQETIAQSILTHYSQRFQRAQDLMRANPVLMLGGVTVGWLHAAFRLIDQLWAPGQMQGVSVPVEIISADHDALVDVKAMARAAHLLPNAHLTTVAGARHEILLEIDTYREQFWHMWDAA